MKRGKRNVVLDKPIREFAELRLRIGRIGEAHRGVGVAQAPAGPERHATGELRELAHDVANPRPDEDVVVEIAVVDLRVAVEPVVVVVFATEIERGGGERVVEEPVGRSGIVVATEQEGPMLV